MAEWLKGDADIDGQYRYWLLRRVAEGDKTVLFVGLNPSRADARKDDHTIRRWRGLCPRLEVPSAADGEPECVAGPAPA